MSCQWETVRTTACAHRETTETSVFIPHSLPLPPVDIPDNILQRRPFRRWRQNLGSCSRQFRARRRYCRQPSHNCMPFLILFLTANPNSTQTRRPAANFALRHRHIVMPALNSCPSKTCSKRFSSVSASPFFSTHLPATLSWVTLRVTQDDAG